MNAVNVTASLLDVSASHISVLLKDKMIIGTQSDHQRLFCRQSRCGPDSLRNRPLSKKPVRQGTVYWMRHRRRNLRRTTVTAQRSSSTVYHSIKPRQRTVVIAKASLQWSHNERLTACLPRWRSYWRAGLGGAAACPHEPNLAHKLKIMHLTTPQFYQSRNLRQDSLSHGVRFDKRV